MMAKPSGLDPIVRPLMGTKVPGMVTTFLPSTLFRRAAAPSIGRASLDHTTRGDRYAIASDKPSAALTLLTVKFLFPSTALTPPIQFPFTSCHCPSVEKRTWSPSFPHHVPRSCCQ